MIDLGTSYFFKRPYPIGQAVTIFSWADYEQMVAAFPDENKFVRMGVGYNKLALSERWGAEYYWSVVYNSPIWKRVFACVKSEEFIRHVFGVLANAGIEIAMPGEFASRFEFSSLPAQGGGIDPHRDLTSKVVTIICYLPKQGEWRQQWGGGTDALSPRPGVKAMDYKTPRSEFECLLSIPYRPNEACVFVRSDASWHSVGPIQGPVDAPPRRTLTINVERIK